MIEKINITNLKNIINAELKIADEKNKIKEDALYQLDIYKEIINLIDMNDMNVTFNNLTVLSMLFPLIYEQKIAETVDKKITNLTYYLLKLSNEEDLKEEYNKIHSRLKFIFDKINREYEILNNKLAIYISESKSYTYKVSILRGILHRLNNGIVLNDFQIQKIKELFIKNEYSIEKQIIIMEYINHHNIQSKFKDPKISYTTIKMIEDDFELYEIDNIVDKDVNEKYMEWVNSIFDNIISEENSELALELTDSITSWMTKDEFSFTLKSVLNKFLKLLQECKSNMLEDGNYEDLDIRKVIISEYNSYYYKFKNLQTYYNTKLHTFDAENIEDIKESKNIEIKNHLFFATSSTKSYIEKDIEDIPEEYYQRVKKLLEGFKYGTLQDHNMELLTSHNNLKGYRKLKEDQIRIVYRNINKDNYLILGVMVKKADNIIREYLSIIKRDYNYDISNEELYLEYRNQSEQIYDNLINYLNEFSRKGNR